MKTFIIIFALLFLGIGIALGQIKLKVLIADETFVIDNEKTFVIETSNEITIKQLIISNFKRCVITPKFDRLGKYHQYSFYFDKLKRDEIVDTILQRKM